ncbi:MAG TPA: chromophore lyase CpcT/CpeT [Candidatus Obscuribacterales bacterium]
MNEVKTSILLIAIGSLIANPAVFAQTAPDVNLPVEHQAAEVVSHLVGVMDTSAQAVTNSKSANVRMTTCKIQVQDALERDRHVTFLYQEQALSQKLDQPYRQRFLRIAPSSEKQSVRSLSFRPAQAETWIGLCKQPEARRVVTLQDLGTPVCSVWLQKSGTTYVGLTPAEGCPANVRGAVRITNRIVLHSTGMDTWDRGFDAAGKQVWGADSDSYQFRWVNPR